MCNYLENMNTIRDGKILQIEQLWQLIGMTDGVLCMLRTQPLYGKQTLGNLAGMNNGVILFIACVTESI